MGTWHLSDLIPPLTAASISPVTCSLTSLNFALSFKFSRGLEEGCRSDGNRVGSDLDGGVVGTTYIIKNRQLPAQLFICSPGKL